jgi:hypothetical protein
MVKAVLPNPGSVIELSSDQKKKLFGDVVGFPIGGNIFLFNQDVFEGMLKSALNEIDDLKKRRKVRRFLFSEILEIKDLRVPSKNHKRILVTV